MIAPQAILVLSNHGEIVGGGEISLLTLLERLDRTRWLPIVVAPSEGAVISRCRTIGMTTHVVPFPSVRWPSLARTRAGSGLPRVRRAELRSPEASMLHKCLFFSA